MASYVHPRSSKHAQTTGATTSRGGYLDVQTKRFLDRIDLFQTQSTRYKVTVNGY